MPCCQQVQYENGERRINVVEFVTIARALGADPLRLLRSSDSSNTPLKVACATQTSDQEHGFLFGALQRHERYFQGAGPRREALVISGQFQDLPRRAQKCDGRQVQRVKGANRRGKRLKRPCQHGRR